MATPTELPLEFGPKHGYWEKTHLICNFNRKKRIKWWPQVPERNMVAKGKWGKVEPLRNLRRKHGFMGQMGPSFFAKLPICLGKHVHVGTWTQNMILRSNLGELSMGKLVA